MKYTVAKSNIQGKGLFAKEGYKKGEIIGLSHENNQPISQIGKYHNHSDKPNAVSIKKGNQRFLIANVDIPSGVEITANYRKQPELEQPEDFQQEVKTGGEGAINNFAGGGTSKPPKWSLQYNPYAYNAGNVVGGYERYGDLTSQNLQLSTPDLFGREKKLNATRFPLSISAGRMYDKSLSNDYGVYGKTTNYDGYGNYEYKTPQELLDSKTTPFAGGIPLDAEISFGVEGSGINPNMKKRSKLGAQLEVGYNPVTGVYEQLNTKQKWALGNNYTNELNKKGEWRVEPYVTPLNFQFAQKPTDADQNKSYDQYLQGLVDSGSSYDPLDPNNPLHKDSMGQVEGKNFVSTGAGVDAQVKLPLGMLDAGIGASYNWQQGQGQKFSPTAHLGYKIALDELGDKINIPAINLPERSPFRSMSVANSSGTRYDNSLFEKDIESQGSVRKANASPVNKQWQPEAEDIFIDWKNQPSGQTFTVDPSTGEAEEEADYKNGGEYIELDLTPEEIEEYAKGGFIIEDISVPSLNQMKNGGEPKRKKSRFVEGTYDPNETAGYELTEEEVNVPVKASAWGKAAIAYEKKNPEEAFIDKKKKQFLRKNKGLNELYGVDMQNFPQDVEQNFKNEYAYKKNTAVVKKVGRQEGWNPNKRTQYVDDLNDTQRGIVAESKYGSKLQPTYWDRTLAGLATLGSKFSPELRDAMNKGYMPGLTQKESQEILNAKMTKIPFTDIDLPFSIPTGGLESFAALEIPGTIPANYLKNTGLSTGSSYKEMPSWYSGEKMANVTDTDVTALNPLTYAGLEAIPELGINLAKGAYKAGSAGVDLAKTNPQAWFKTPEQILETPGLYSSAMGRTSWKDPVGKLNKFVDDAKIKSSYKRENALLDKYPGFENRNTRIPLQQEEQLKRLEIEKAIEERNLRRTKLPIKQVLTEQGTKLGGGQGRIFVNTLNPDEVVKIGTFPGGSEDLANLVQTGKDLEGMPLMENVAFPTKAFTLKTPKVKGNTVIRSNSEAVQFMPWKGNPLNAENPINKPLGFGVPSDKAKRELQYMAELLDENKVGIDYFGQNNIMYDPATDSYKLVDLNYVDNPKSQFDWNNLDKPVKQRIEDKFGYEIPKEVSKELPGSPNQTAGFAKNINGDTFNAIPAKSAFSQAVSNLSSAVTEIPKSIKYQVNNYSNIKKAPALVKDEIGKMLTPEGIDRLKNLGVDDIDDFMSYMDKNKLFTKRNLKSHAGTGVSNGQQFPYMNLDFDQLDKAFNISKIKDKNDAIRAVISHELGHNIQGYLEHIGKSTDGLSSLDKEAVLKLKPFMDKNADPDVLNYFLQGSKGSEPLAHLRELKQNMLYKGVIDDIHQKITPEDLGNFYINKSGYRDRVMSIVKPGDDAYKRLASLLNKTPVAIPAALGAGTLLNQEKDGGQIIIDDLTDAQLEQYIRGGYIIEEIH